jgi:hypothetical protein
MSENQLNEKWQKETPTPFEGVSALALCLSDIVSAERDGGGQKTQHKSRCGMHSNQRARTNPSPSSDEISYHSKGGGAARQVLHARGRE